MTTRPCPCSCLTRAAASGAITPSRWMWKMAASSWRARTSPWRPWAAICVKPTWRRRNAISPAMASGCRRSSSARRSTTPGWSSPTIPPRRACSSTPRAGWITVIPRASSSLMRAGTDAMACGSSTWPASPIPRPWWTSCTRWASRCFCGSRPSSAPMARISCAPSARSRAPILRWPSICTCA